MPYSKSEHLSNLAVSMQGKWRQSSMHRSRREHLARSEVPKRAVRHHRGAARHSLQWEIGHRVTAFGTELRQAILQWAASWLHPLNWDSSRPCWACQETCSSSSSSGCTERKRHKGTSLAFNPYHDCSHISIHGTALHMCSN
jgi:hypothetical protein